MQPWMDLSKILLKDVFLVFLKINFTFLIVNKVTIQIWKEANFEKI